MSTKRILNGILAIAILAALSINAACNTDGWTLVGEIFGWTLLIGGTFLVVDNRIKESEVE